MQRYDVGLLGRVDGETVVWGWLMEACEACMVLVMSGLGGRVTYEDEIEEFRLGGPVTWGEVKFWPGGLVTWGEVMFWLGSLVTWEFTIVLWLGAKFRPGGHVVMKGVVKCEGGSLIR